MLLSIKQEMSEMPCDDDEWTLDEDDAYTCALKKLLDQVLTHVILVENLSEMEINI